MRASLLSLVLACVACGAAAQQASSNPEPFEGELNPVAGEAPRPVRNAAHQPGREVVTLRYFKIKHGTFPEFLAASRDQIWPYFEKLGARVIGMWRVVPPPGAQREPREYDEVYLATRYASAAHWAATRDTALHGGNGPDFEACRRGLAYRESVTLATHVLFLEGELAPGGPYFMPGLPESYERLE
jgi:hypothetical protein